MLFRLPAYFLKWFKIQIVPLFFNAIAVPQFVERNAFSVEHDGLIYVAFFIGVLFALRPSLSARFPFSRSFHCVITPRNCIVSKHGF